MLYAIRRINPVLLLLILLISCAGQPQDRNVSPTLAVPTAQTIFHLDRSALSYGVFETGATSVSMDVSNTMLKRFSAFADISIEDGSGVTTYKVQPGESTIVHSMPAGEKRVTITSGMQTNFRNEITGVFITKIIFNGAALQVQEDNKRIVIYGDSITVGGRVDHLSAEAWPVLLRRHYSVMIEAYSYRMLYDDTFPPAKRAELASKISAWRPDYIWLAIGANDYAFGQWSAREFGEAYAATLDAIHLSNPRALLFAQSPLLQAGESANVLGSDLESYRVQIATACLARSAWCTFVDGTDPAFPQPDELDKDGVHLTTKSSVKYAEAVLHIIGK